METLIQHIKIPALKGTKTIASAKGFAWIDLDFKNYGTDKKGKATKAMELAVQEMDKDATFKDIFTNPEAMCLSQEQILHFIENHQEKLRQGGWATFFLFKVDSEFFVALVFVKSDGLCVYAYRFSYDDVWLARIRRRVVVPQLALAPLDPESLSPSGSLTLERAIEMVKEAGMVIYQPI